MTKTHCPYLTNWDAHGRKVSPIEYPSFENHCLGLDDASSLLLTDQATFCLSGSHRFCPLHTEPVEETMAQPASPLSPRRHPFQRPSIPNPASVSASASSPAPSPSHQTTPFVPWEQGPSPVRHTDSGPSAWQTVHVTEDKLTPTEQENPHGHRDLSGQEDSLEDDLLAIGLRGMGLPAQDSMEQEGRSWEDPATRWWAWAGAALLFVAVIGMGGLFSAYAGWQIALERLVTARAGQVSTLASGPIQVQPQVQPQLQPLYLVMTATSKSETIASNGATDNGTVDNAVVIQSRTGQGIKPDPVIDPIIAGNPDSQNGFPVAVTASPVKVPPAQVSPDEGSPVIVVPLPSAAISKQDTLPVDTVQPTNTPVPIVPIQLPPLTNVATVVPVINVFVPVPSRRPTPEFDIPTSTPEPLGPTPINITPTNTLAPLLGPPIIIFAPDESAVPPGKCTKVRWHVENVREVYYENQPTFGEGIQEECLKDERDIFALTIVFGDGQTKIYTTTVDIIEPTLTPSITPSFTPEILPTETWTPEPPTPEPATPTPNVVYGTTLTVNGDNPTSCNAGEQCIIDVLATNTGDSLDTIAIELVSIGSWSAMLCSQLGTCGSPRLVIANVGPANTVFVNLQITIPADATGQRTNYGLRSVSEGAGGSVTSQITDLTITVNE